MKTVPHLAATTTSGPLAAPRGVTRRMLLTGAVTTTLLAACGRPSIGSAPASAGPWEFTDDRSVTISLPKRPERAVARVTAAAALWDYGVRPIARFEDLSTLLGADPTSTSNVDANNGFNQAVANFKAAMTPKRKLKVMVVAGGRDTLYVANAKVVTDLIFYKELGLDLVTPEVNTFWENLNWEQVNKYPADLILTDARGGAHARADESQGHLAHSASRPGEPGVPVAVEDVQRSQLHEGAPGSGRRHPIGADGCRLNQHRVG